MKKIQFSSKKIKTLAISLTIVVAGWFSFSFVNQNFEITKNLEIFSTLFRELVINYVDEVNPGDLMKTGITEMLESLDPYTNFIPESELEDYQFMTTGQYGGIGALIQKRGDYIMITDPYEGFPAFKAGLLPGDYILQINEKDVKSLDASEVTTLLKGQPGTSINLLIKRDGEENPIKKTLTREIVKISNIPYSGMLDTHTAYIRLTGFTANAGREVRDALAKLKEANEVKQVILDLRGNGGGLLNEAVNITNLFVDKGKHVVSTKGKIKERNSMHRTLNSPFDTEVPLAVLVDRGSASASEIVAGAIQDFDRGVIIGQRTFGKGLVQNVVPLAYNTRLKVTVAKYYIPSGRCIQAIDYAQRNEDGSVSFIPDSLKSPFKTSNGRIVYDGGGIEPDIPLEPRRLSNISISLIINHHIFDFATHFYRKNLKFISINDLKITDGIFKDFVAFLDGKDYDYEVGTEVKIKELRQIAQTEKYLSAIEKELLALEQKVSHNKEEDLNTFRDEIEMLLLEEIASRYFYQKGRVEASLRHDPEIKKAIEVLDNQSKYASILKISKP